MSQERWSRRTVVIASLALLAGAAVVRLTGLTGESFWVDEEYSRQWVRPASPADTVFSCAEDQHPPLYFVGLWGWSHVCGPSDFALRGFSVLIGAATVALAFLLVRLTLPDGIALAFACLLAVNPAHVYLSQELRQYGLLALWSVSAFALGASYLAKPSAGAFWGLALSVVCGLYTHNYFAFLLLPAGVVLGVVFAREPRERGRILLGLATVGLLYAPWVPVLLEQVHRGGPSYLRNSYPSVAGLLYLLTSGTRELLPPAVNKPVALMGSPLVLAGYVVACRRWPRGVGWVCLLFGLASLLPIILWTSRHGMWSPKSMVWATYLGLLAVAGLVLSLKRGSAPVLVALLALSLGATALTLVHKTKDDWRAAGKFLSPEAAGRLAPNDLRVVVFLPIIGDAMVHYTPGLSSEAIIVADGNVVAHTPPHYLRRGLLAPAQRAAKVAVAVWGVAPEVVDHTTRALAESGLRLTTEQPFTGLSLLVFERARAAREAGAR